MQPLVEVAKGVVNFIHGHRDDPNARRRVAPEDRIAGGRHQVTYLGKHGDFHLYSAVDVLDHNVGIGMNPERAEASMSTEEGRKALADHLGKIHTADEIEKKRNEAHAWSQAHETDTGIPHPPHMPVFHDPTLHNKQHYIDAALHATKRRIAAGLPAQTRTAVIFDQSKQMNHNTGVKGDVAGHWDKYGHVIALNSHIGNDPYRPAPDTANTLTHEWAHAFHDEMSKDQKRAWTGFYKTHVAGPAQPQPTDEELEKYKKSFTDYVVSHPNVRAADRALTGHRNRINPDASMLDSVHSGGSTWWGSMKDQGHLSGGKSVIATTSNTLLGYDGTPAAHRELDNGHTKKNIRRGTRVRVQAFDPSNPDHVVRAKRDLYGSEDHKDLFAVSPLNNPKHVAIVSKYNLNASDSESRTRGRTYLHPEAEKTRAQPGFTEPKMSDEWKTEWESQSKASRTSEYAQERAKRSNNLDTAAQEGHIHALKAIGKYDQHNDPYGTNTGIKNWTIHSPSYGFGERIYRHIQDAPHNSVISAVDAVTRGNVAADAPRDTLSGGHMQPFRSAAFNQHRVFRSYGASNDHELFATTAEHVADLRKKPQSALHPHERRLVRAWHNVIHGTKAESVVSRINSALLAESEISRDMVVPAGTTLYHGSPHDLSGGISFHARGKFTGEHGLISLTTDKGLASGYGHLYAHTTQRPLRLISYRHPLSAEQADIVNKHFDLPDYKRVTPGTALSTAVEWRAGAMRDSHAGNHPAYPQVPAEHGDGHLVPMYPGLLRKLGYDGMHNTAAGSPIVNVFLHGAPGERLPVQKES